MAGLTRKLGGKAGSEKPIGDPQISSPCSSAGEFCDNFDLISKILSTITEESVCDYDICYSDTSLYMSQ